MTPEIALQKAVRIRLTSEPNVIALVPAANILDRNGRPNPRPSIIIGEGMSRDEGDSIARNLTRVWMDLHIWIKEPSTTGVKAVVGAIRTALRERLEAGNVGIHIVDAYVESARFLRDPDGETSHAIVTIDARVEVV
ncbi:DUF3168 domain-containing protein [Rhizobium sp. Root483D2]|uniref:DUF3168 domain-containing protein n=1 Tax=Rhizobium sp. Root483D2 TaxID=1736545 RepID=UPI0007159A6D|nr:DUF3168 domain-containing protein [Rhizobium sp. Root483D2]KQY21023.1 hypothetical protein ASD32_06490 [Rhizobium sp. Root483D2]